MPNRPYGSTTTMEPIFPSSPQGDCVAHLRHPGPGLYRHHACPVQVVVEPVLVLVPARGQGLPPPDPASLFRGVLTPLPLPSCSP